MNYQTVSQSQIAYVIYTSGSTGNPKGAIIEHAGMLNHIYAKLSDLEMSEHDTVAQIASQSFDISIWQMFSALCIGGKTIIIDDEVVYKPLEFFKVIKDNNVSILEVVPTYLSLLLDYAPDSSVFDSLRYVLVTGETLKYPLVKRFFEKFPGIKLVNAYGPTEASDDICHYIMHQAPESPVIPVGSPLKNLNIYIVDEQMQLCPTGFPGEICVSGVGVGLGYLNNPEKTQNAFVHDSYRIYKTGDIGRWLPTGDIEFLGRKDEQIKIRGYRIELGEIEQTIMTLDGNIKECVVMLREEAVTGEKYLVAFLMSINNDAENELKRDLARLLPDYMIPHQLVFLDEMPLTPNGKIDKNILKEMKIDTFTSGKGIIISPAGDIEERLLKIYKHVLKQDSAEIGVTDNFFDLGGNSLKVITLSTLINKEFNIELSIVDIFTSPTVRELSEKVKIGKSVQIESIPASTILETYPLTDAQKGIFFECMLNPGSVNYNIPIVLEISGVVDISILRAVFNNILDRHIVFRLYFEVQDGVPRQIVADSVSFDIEVLVTNRPFDALKECINPIELSNPPLIKVFLLKSDINETSYLLINVHHIICDGHSIDILKDEFMKLYSGEALPAIGVQFTDYVSWQNTPVYKELYQKNRQYWINRFSDKVVQENNWIDIIQATNNKTQKEGDLLSVWLDSVLSNKIQEYSSANNVTINVFLLSVYYILVLPELEYNDIIIGIPATGRSHPDLEYVAGMFVNVLPVRNKVVKMETFKDFMNKVKTSMIHAIENQSYPYQELIAELRKKKLVQKSSLFNLMFSSADMEYGSAFENSQVKMHAFNYSNHIKPHVKTDLNMRAFVGKDAIKIDLEYATSLFRKEKIENCLNKFVGLISNITSGNDELKIEELECMIN